MALTVVRGGLGDVFPGSAATHAGSRLGEGGLELFGAGAVDLGDRYYGVGRSSPRCRPWPGPRSR
jgi:hypothetical protein